MIGSAGLAAWIARLAFPVLLCLGWARGAPGPRALGLFAVLGAALWLGLPRVTGGALFVTPALALLDVILVLVVFKGDVRLAG